MPKVGGEGTQRVNYYDGQLLTSRDLQDDMNYETRMRGLHVRALHETWGVALGFKLNLSDDHRQVAIGPGLAYDCRGREILQVETICIEGPQPTVNRDAVNHAFDLTIHYREIEEWITSQDHNALCPARGIGVFEERPAYRWVLAGEIGDPHELPIVAEGVRLGEEIPLGRFDVRPTGEMDGLDLRVRRNARSLLRPHVAFGITKQGELQWQQNDFGLQVKVSTKAGGFSTEPHYFVRFIQNPWFMNAEVKNLDGIVGPFLSIQAPQPSCFQLHLYFAGMNPNIGTSLLDGIRQHADRASFSWVGVETVRGCLPILNLFRFFTQCNLPIQDSGNWLKLGTQLGFMEMAHGTDAFGESSRG